MTHFLMLNCLIGQFFKRFFYRKRPFLYQPARAFSLTVQRSSSTPSRVVMVGTTMMYSVARCANESDQMHYFMCILTAAVAFLILMWMRSHLGSCYPSDCLLAIVPIALIIGFSEFINATDYIYGCQDCCNDKVCYYNPDQDITQKIVPIDLDSFNLGSLNKQIFTITFIIAYLIFAFLTSYPLEFWRKTPNLFAWIMSIYLFQISMICPRTQSQFQAVLDPSYNEVKLSSSAYFVLISLMFLVFNFVVARITASLLGRRTGQLLSLALRSVFYIAILVWNLTFQISMRLMIVQGQSKMIK